MAGAGFGSQGGWSRGGSGAPGAGLGGRALRSVGAVVGSAAAVSIIRPRLVRGWVRAVVHQDSSPHPWSMESSGYPRRPKDQEKEGGGGESIDKDAETANLGPVEMGGAFGMACWRLAPFNLVINELPT
jgi:hypothetical protein